MTTAFQSDAFQNNAFQIDSDVSNGPSGIRRLALYDLYGHPQIKLAKHKRLQDEEEETLALLLSMIDDFME